MTPLQHEPSAHAPWMRTIFGRAFISGVPSRSFPDNQADPTMPSSPAGRYPQHYCTSYDQQGHARGRSSISEKKNHRRSENQFLLSERRWWHIPENLRARNVQSDYVCPGCGLARMADEVEQGPVDLVGVGPDDRVRAARDDGGARVVEQGGQPAAGGLVGQDAILVALDDQDGDADRGQVRPEVCQT